MTSTQAYFYPDCLGRILLQAMDEILGINGVKSVLNFANLADYIGHEPACDRELNFPFRHVSGIQAALEGIYGARAGQGLACRLGRASYKYILREFGSELGLTGLNFHLLPMPTRLKSGLQSLADLYNRFTDQRVRIVPEGNLVSWNIMKCPFCWGRQGIEPACGLEVGLLQEALYSFSGGKYFCVEEKSCVACGDIECKIEIDQIPMS
jgi:predicted hydrocarbon binding protein